MRHQLASKTCFFGVLVGLCWNGIMASKNIFCAWITGAKFRALSVARVIPPVHVSAAPPPPPEFKRKVAVYNKNSIVRRDALDVHVTSRAAVVAIAEGSPRPAFRAYAIGIEVLSEASPVFQRHPF